MIGLKVNYGLCFFRMDFIKVLVVVCLIAPASVKSQTFLCVTEKATGFYYRESSRSWETADFRVGTKYVASPSDEKGYKFIVTELGKPKILATSKCEYGFNMVNHLVCDFGYTTFLMNKVNGRFIRASHGGYFNYDPTNPFMGADESKSDTPVMEIGKCSEIDVR